MREDSSELMMPEYKYMCILPENLHCIAAFRSVKNCFYDARCFSVHPSPMVAGLPQPCSIMAPYNHQQYLVQRPALSASRHCS